MPPKDTKRLTFRSWRDDDLELGLLLWGDPDVMEMIDSRGALSKEQILQKLSEEIALAGEHSIQYWPVFKKSNDEFVGVCGLRPYKEQGVLEIGFQIRTKFWGQGLATEAAEAVIDYAFGELQVSALFAGHNPKNAASRHMLEKMGFTYTHDEYYEPTGLKHPSYILKSSKNET